MIVAEELEAALERRSHTKNANVNAPQILRNWWHFCLLLCLLTGCVSRSPKGHQPIVSGIVGPTPSLLHSRIEAQVATNQGRSGFYVLDSNLEAFLARVQMVDAAQHTLDIQSYIMRGDATGRILGDRILAAADRGVKVRLLVDDVSVLWKDSSISRLDGHSNIELRVFNPFIGIRTSRWLVLYDFVHAGRLTRRMHNKLFAADNALAIVGGRNIGDEYFFEREGISFMDLDVWVAGPAVAQLANSFNEYWNSDWAYPVAAFRSARKEARDYRAVRQQMRPKAADENTAFFQTSIRTSDLLPRLLAGNLPLEWAHARVVYDLPTKVDGGSSEEESIQVSPEVWHLAENVREELIVISPYFVPGHEGVALFRKLRQRGVRVRILTNSLRSTDVLLAHTGYVRYRHALLEAGVELYELKPTAVSRRQDATFFLRRRAEASLHTKSFIFDRRTVFIGSMNLDQRAHYLNTELGLIIEDPELANTVAHLFSESIHPRNSYRVQLKTSPTVASPKMGGASQRKTTVWITEENGRQVRHAAEPNAGICLQLWTSFLRLLPLEGQL